MEYNPMGATAEELREFSRLYRKVTTDLSLATVYRLPEDLSDRLQDLVSRAHSFLHSGRKDRGRLRKFFLETLPAGVFSDRYAWSCIAIFYILFSITGILGYQYRDFASSILGEATLQQYESMHSGEREEITAGDSLIGSSYYILNNLSLSLLCYGLGILAGVGSLYMLVYNGFYLGTLIGFLLHSPARDNILNWILAHGPFELTAIGLSAGAGLRTGLAFFSPGSNTRLRAVTEAGLRSVPALTADVILTFIAAFIEGFVAPSALPTEAKAAIGIICFVLIILYFVIYGWRVHSGRTPDTIRAT
ncbi:MAG: stage II sporulation protein M [Leptospiraceae bacterium]|nr:stage II sporulation protein M [Leptospiraceae bacterium]